PPRSSCTAIPTSEPWGRNHDEVLPTSSTSWPRVMVAPVGVDSPKRIPSPLSTGSSPPHADAPRETVGTSGLTRRSGPSAARGPARPTCQIGPIGQIPPNQRTATAHAGAWRVPPLTPGPTPKNPYDSGSLRSSLSTREHTRESAPIREPRGG